MALLLLILQRRLHLGWGKLFVSYVLWYSFGRFFIEMIRIDPVDTVHGVRINDWTDGAVFIGAIIVMVILVRLRPGPDEHPFGPVGDAVEPVVAAGDDETMARPDEAADDATGGSGVAVEGLSSRDGTVTVPENRVEPAPSSDNLGESETSARASRHAA
jgi:prolipoprotein diacylglyceryltransferase